MPLCPKMGDKGPRIRLWLKCGCLPLKRRGGLQKCPPKATRNPIQSTAVFGFS